MTNSRSNQAVMNLLRRVKSDKKGKRKQPKRAAPTSMMRSVNIPAQQTYQLRNTVPDSRCVFRGHEQISQFSVGPTTPVGTLFKIDLNPADLLYAGSRIQSLCKVFQKYRFRVALLTVGNVTGTSTGGALVVAYSENPDYSVGNNAARTLAAMEGSITSALWMPIDCKASIGDRTKWYNIDSDSNELMQICQGKFMIAVQYPPTTSGDVILPVYLDYEIECMGTAVQNFDVTGQQFPFPNTTVVDNPIGANNQITLINQETTELPFPTLNISTSTGPTGAVYFINPSMTFQDGAGSPVQVQYLACTAQSAGEMTVVVFETLADVNSWKTLICSQQTTRNQRVLLQEYF
jgi:hypothetical protein